MSAMYSKALTDKAYFCTACNTKGHTQDRCWSVLGYPRWHSKHKKFVPKPQTLKPQISKWNTRPQSNRMANVAQGTVDKSEPYSITFTPHQLKQLLKLLPVNSDASPRDSPTDEELENYFSGMISCHLSTAKSNERILDSGATNHMTSSFTN